MKFQTFDVMLTHQMFLLSLLAITVASTKSHYDSTYYDLTGADSTLYVYSQSLEGGSWSPKMPEHYHSRVESSFGIDHHALTVNLRYSLKLNQSRSTISVSIKDDSFGVGHVRNITTLGHGINSLLGTDVAYSSHSIDFIFANETTQRPLSRATSLQRSLPYSIPNDELRFEFNFYGNGQLQQSKSKGIPEHIFPRNVRGHFELFYSATTWDTFSFELMFKDNNGGYHWAEFGHERGWVGGNCSGKEEQQFSVTTFRSDLVYVFVDFYL
ncbi:hypothetical protein P9112_014398 [Eukaryota sp. TZLM1-RC]